jgi:hypothetical protein
VLAGLLGSNCLAKGAYFNASYFSVYPTLKPDAREKLANYYNKRLTSQDILNYMNSNEDLMNDQLSRVALLNAIGIYTFSKTACAQEMIKDKRFVRDNMEFINIDEFPQAIADIFINFASGKLTIDQLNECQENTNIIEDMSQEEQSNMFALVKDLILKVDEIVSSVLLKYAADPIDLACCCKTHHGSIHKIFNGHSSCKPDNRCAYCDKDAKQERNEARKKIS